MATLTGSALLTACGGAAAPARSPAVGATITGCDGPAPGSAPAPFAITVRLVNRTTRHQVVSVTATGVDRSGHRRTVHRRLAVLQPLSTSVVALTPDSGPSGGGPPTRCRLVTVAAAPPG